MGCLFCNIIKGEVPSTKIYENDRVYAFGTSIRSRRCTSS